MRPTKLTISAFGPYADAVEVPFDALGDAGLYLICGDTGAGKTTIFDAIMFALYGRASGSDRDPRSLRSDFALPDVETFVELTFEYRGRAYRIRRSPSYDRPKKRGEGMTSVASSVEFERPDAPPITNIKQANEAIEALLGIDASQFSSIAMIAQGDFRKLLTAGTKERSDIFRKLFETDYCRRFQRALTDARKALDAECRDIRIRLLTKAQNASFACETLERERDERLAQDTLTTEWLRDALDAQLEQDIPIAEKTESELADARSKRDELKSALARAARIAELEAALADAESARERAAAEQANAEQARAAEEERAEQAEQLRTRQSILKDSMDSYRAYDEACTRYAAAQAALKKSTAEQGKCQSVIDGLEAARAQARQTCDELAGIDVRVAQCRSAEQAARTRLATAEERIGNSEKRARERTGLAHDLADAQEQYRLLRERAATVEQEYRSQQQRYLDGQAGLLAAELADGAPCPVCGSTEHPRPALPEQAVPAKDEVDSLRRQAETAAAACQSASANAGNKKAMLEMHDRETERIEQREGTLEALLAESESARVEVESAQDNSTAATRDKSRFDRAKSQLADFDRTISDQNMTLQNLTAILQQCETDMTACATRCETLAKHLPAQSREDAQRELDSLDAQISERTASLEARRNAANEAKAALAGAVERTTLLKRQLAEQKPVDADATQQALDALEDRIERLQRETENRNLRIRQNRATLAAITADAKHNEQLERRYAEVKELEDTANGQMKGQARISFETYMQAMYLDQVVEAANRRLTEMTDGRYRLARREDDAPQRGQAGLDLDVRDFYTGKQRAASSLSGGESFLAALSLALGLSDVVQQRAGGIRLDAMFIDEGFGSLDPEALSGAIRALTTLSGNDKLIGIISHVEDLKQSIDRRIIVENDRNGSHLRVEA